MKLIIDIPEEVYKRMINGDLPIYMAYKYVKNGTPLDDIKAEIANLDDADYDYEGYYKAVTDAVEIIDKYIHGNMLV